MTGRRPLFSSEEGNFHVVSAKAENPVTIGFTTTRSLMSKFIRWILRSKVSHTWVSWYDCSVKKRLVIEATDPKVRVDLYDRIKENEIIVEEYKFNNPNSMTALTSIMSNLTLSYDFLGAIFTAVKVRFKKLYRKIFKPKDTPDKLTCHELVARYLIEAKSKVADKIDTETIGPNGLMELVSNSDEFEKIE